MNFNVEGLLVQESANEGFVVMVHFKDNPSQTHVFTTSAKLMKFLKSIILPRKETE